MNEQTAIAAAIFSLLISSGAIWKVLEYARLFGRIEESLGNLIHAHEELKSKVGDLDEIVEVLKRQAFKDK